MLEAAQSIALIPDLLALWLCGQLANEATIASTTGLLRAGAARWASPVIEAMGLPQRMFKHVVEPGTELGTLIDAHADQACLDAGVPVFAVASHDTASAFVAAPMRKPDCSAVLCSGTWSLLGVELEEPVLSEAAMAANLTNERGVDGATRLLKNVRGCGCCRSAGARGLAGSATTSFSDWRTRPILRCRCLTPTPRSSSLLVTCRGGLPTPAGRPPRTRRERGAIVRSVLTSLACKYRYVVEHLEHVTGRSLATVHAIGGGAQNTLLCQLTADVVGRSVLAGPVEASALGNVLVQARAAGWFDSLAEMREAVLGTVRVESYEPGPRRDEDEAIYQRFLEVTGLRTPAPPERGGGRGHA